MRQSSNDGSVQESRRGRWHKTDDGPNSEERALQRFAQMMIEKISSFQGDWKKPWFTEGALTWPKNLTYSSICRLKPLSKPDKYWRSAQSSYLEQ